MAKLNKHPKQTTPQNQSMFPGSFMFRKMQQKTTHVPCDLATPESGGASSLRNKFAYDMTWTMETKTQETKQQQT